MAGFQMSVTGLKPIVDLLLKHKGPIAAPLATGVMNLGMKVEGLAKKACPVLNNRLRPSITTQAFGDHSTVGTNVEYGEYVEYGTPSGSMEPRHVEGGQARVLGMGPFAYALLKLKEGAANSAKGIASDIENRFNFQKLRGFKPSMPNLPFF